MAFYAWTGWRAILARHFTSASVPCSANSMQALLAGNSIFCYGFPRARIAEKNLFIPSLKRRRDESPCVRLARMFDNRLWRALFEDTPVLHHRDLVGHGTDHG